MIDNKFDNIKWIVPIDSLANFIILSIDNIDCSGSEIIGNRVFQERGQEALGYLDNTIKISEMLGFSISPPRKRYSRVKEVSRVVRFGDLYRDYFPQRP